MIAFPCPQCGKVLKIKEELAGKKGKCPSCGALVTVPIAVVAGAGPDKADSPTIAPTGGSGRIPDGSETQTCAASDATGNTQPAGDSSEWDFLSPPRGTGEIGWLGTYRVLKVLGTGGMGVVFQAEDPSLKRIVAIKAMKPTLAVSAAAGQRFQREAQATAALKHDNIVTIYQVGEDRGVPFIAMEFLEGEPLEARLRREGTLPLAEVIRIGKEIARGLAAAHKRDLMHRDIKPANIWLEADGGRVKIVDFGLARASGQESSVTQTGAIIGTPAYMAPEQASGQKVDHRCDLFSLGCVLYQLCTGARPFKGNDTISTLMAVATVNPTPPRQLSKQIPAGLSDLVMKLLEKQPDHRPATAQAVVDALTAIEAEPTLPRERVEITEAMPRRSGEPSRTAVPAPARLAGPTSRTKAKKAGAIPWHWVGIGGGGILLVVVVLLAVLGGGKTPPDDKKNAAVPPKQGKESPFFNGKDLDGWEGLSQFWSVKDNTIVGSTMPGGVKFNTFLCSKKTYKDFELKFQVRLKGDNKANSGVQLRSKLTNRDKFTVIGPQADMGAGFWGSLYGEGTRGMMKAAPAEKVNKVLKNNDFNDYLIRCTGNHVLIQIDGLTTVDDDFADLPSEGIIAWQIHAGPGMEVAFRNIEFKELAGQTTPVAGEEKILFAGKDLSGWVNRKDGLRASWPLADDYVEVGTGNFKGNGDIMTREKFGPDFQLHVEFWVPFMPDRKGQGRGNSGVFLQGRHEIQILDSFGIAKPGAADCGALYGLIAPKVNASKPPQEWQTFDITFHAPRFDDKGLFRKGRLTVLHNGIPIINDAPFERVSMNALDPKGVGQPGPILLQSHGGNKVRFRNIRLRELKAGG